MSVEKYFLGRNVRHLREKRGWTKLALAQMMGSTETFINTIENNSLGNMPPNFSVVARFASIFGVSQQALLFHDIASRETVLFSNTEAIKPASYYGDAGNDLILVDDLFLPPFTAKKALLGTSACIPDGYFMWLTTRSSADLKNISINGIVDSGYEQTLSITVKNHSWRPRLFKKGERIAQAILVQMLNPYSADHNMQRRRKQGFGSTGQ